jgi:hypothetical protein
MCPACLTAAAWWITGSVSAGGVLTLGALRRSKKPRACDTRSHGRCREQAPATEARRDRFAQ